MVEKGLETLEIPSGIKNTQGLLPQNVNVILNTMLHGTLQL